LLGNAIANYLSESENSEVSILPKDS